MNNFRFIKFLFASIFLLQVVVGCQKKVDEINIPGATKGLQLELTVTDTYDYDDVQVRIKSIEANVTRGATSSWEALTLIDSNVNKYINIHTLRHGNLTKLGTLDIPVNSKISSFRIRFDASAMVIKKGVTYTLNFPDSIKNNGYLIPASYTLPQSNSLALAAEWTISESVIFDSEANTYTFKPVFRSFDRRVCGSIEGYVKPDEANGYAVISSGTTSSIDKFNVPTIPYKGGYFKLIGVPEGKYKVALKALNGSYKTKEINDVIVYKGVTAGIGTYTLLQ